MVPAMNPSSSISNSEANLLRAITRDPAVFPDAATFNPDRWLNPSYPTYREPLTEYPTIRSFTTFGYGRRICQGQDLVEAELLVGIGGMAWATNICKKRDAAGQEIYPAPHDYTSLLISHPKPFQFELKPRSAKREQQVWDNWKEAANSPDSFSGVAVGNLSEKAMNGSTVQEKHTNAAAINGAAVPAPNTEKLVLDNPVRA